MTRRAAPHDATVLRIPASDTAERAILGAVLSDAKCFYRVLDIITLDDFYSEPNRLIFEAFVLLAGDNSNIELLATTDQLERSGTLKAAGGVAYVASLTDGLPDPANVEHYAGIVRERAIKRELLRVSQETAAACGGDGGDVEAILAAAESTIANARARLGPADHRGSRAFRASVETEAARLRVRAEAARIVRQESALQRPFDAVLLADIHDEPAPSRIKGVLSAGGRMLLAAQRKGGKTTTVLNLCLDVIRGGAFLGRFPVEPIAVTRRVAFLNFEMSRYQFGRWARAIGIPGDRLLTVHLRGCSNPFANPDDIVRLAELMREYGVEVVIVDPFGRAYPGKSQNDAGEVGAWLSDLDRFANAAGCSELVLTAHAGWEGERTRGTSALEDWADVVAYLVRDKEDDRLRYFRALGRDVEVEEDRLNFDPVTRRLTLAGAGNRVAARAQRRTDGLISGVVEAVTKEPGATTRQLDALLRDVGLAHQRGDAGRGARAAVEAGLIVRVPGKRGSFQHFLKGHEGDRSRPFPTVPAGNAGEVVRPFPTAPIGSGERCTTPRPAQPVGAPAVQPGTLDPKQPDAAPEPDDDDGPPPEVEV